MPLMSGMRLRSGSSTTYAFEGQRDRLLLQWPVYGIAPSNSVKAKAPITRPIRKSRMRHARGLANTGASRRAP